MYYFNVTKTCITGLLTTGLFIFSGASSAAADNKIPAKKFDLSHWKITLPIDKDGNGKGDEVSVKKLQKYYHPYFFYLDENGGMVFTAPNKGTTTSGSSNTRTELRYQLGGKRKINSSSPRNNFVLARHSAKKLFAQIGGKMEATVKVDHVSTHAGHPEKKPAYAVVVGQIHTGKDKGLRKKTKDLFGWGNEPIKIYYKKWPQHEAGSVFWTYERNLTKKDPNRTDIAYPVWGNLWDNTEDPGAAGIKLGEEFSYAINVYENTMYVEFSAQGKDTVKYSVDLSNYIDPYGKADPLDNKFGYSLDWMYFKAGAYNQCSTKDAPEMWYTACPGTGDWETDKANGDYTQVTFSKLNVSKGTPQAK